MLQKFQLSGKMLPKYAILSKKDGGANIETKLTIGERLKDLRVERDLNQKVVENQVGIPSSTLSTYENDTVGNVNVAAIILSWPSFMMCSRNICSA